MAGIGEVLWDRFPDVDRLGGAPANFAFHAGQLGAEAQIVSRLGHDPDGHRLLKALAGHRLATDFIQSDQTHRTGLVQVKITAGQPSYLIESPAAWDFLELTAELKMLASTLDAVCFGTLAQRHEVSRHTIQKFVQLCPKQTLRLFDINLRQDYFSRETVEFGLAHATVLKLNGEELTQIAQLFEWPSSSDKTLEHLFKLFPITCIAVTHGADGCELITREKAVNAKAPRIKCVDAVGAGDAFSAALVVGLLQQRPLEQIARHANQVGAFVASQSGAMPTLLPQELLPS